MSEFYFEYIKNKLRKLLKVLKTIGMDYLKIKNGVLIGCIGALLLAIGDWLIGYIDPTIIGDSMILVKGCRNVGYIRPVLSMLFAMVGAIMCIITPREPEEVEYHAPCGKCMMVAEDCKYNCKKGRK